MNASTMKTNGMTASPKAMAAPALGAPSASSLATATRPAMIAQNAGTRTRVATVIARHFRCRIERLDPAGLAVASANVDKRHDQPFTEPAVKPRTK